MQSNRLNRGLEAGPLLAPDVAGELVPTENGGAFYTFQIILWVQIYTFQMILWMQNYTFQINLTREKYIFQIILV